MGLNGRVFEIRNSWGLPHVPIEGGKDRKWHVRQASERWPRGCWRCATLLAHSKESAQAVYDAVMQAIGDFTGDRPQADDITLAIIKAL